MFKIVSNTAISKPILMLCIGCFLLAFSILKAHAGLYYTSKLDITYNNIGQQLDLYIPKKEIKKTAVMFIHGGGFNAGIKDDMTFHAKYFARKGYVTTSINYRLGDEGIYPAAKLDTIDAIKWMKKQASTYGYSPDKIVLLGYSAGGAVALNAGFDENTDVAAIVSGAGVTDLNALAITSDIPEIRNNIELYMGGKPAALASPVNQVTKNSPPVLMFHGIGDNIVPETQSIRLARKLKAKLIPHEVVLFDMTGHDLMLETNPHIYEIFKKTGEWLEKIEAGESLR